MTNTPSVKRRELSISMEKAAESVSAAPVEYDSSELHEYIPTKFLSTGSTVLNCACTGDPFKGYGCGTMVSLNGDSDTGKTLLALSAAAEAANNPEFDNYDIIYDDVEAALAMDIRRMYGSKTAARLVPPAKAQDGSAIYSNTVEEAYANIVNRIRKGKPFIYFLDSVDALSDAAELERAVDYGEKVEKHQQEQSSYAVENGEEGMSTVKTEGSYKVNKPKLLSEMLRVVCMEMRSTGSILVMVSQLRDNINPRTAMFQPKVRSGGRAIKFYATHEIWLSGIRKITATAKGADGTTKTGNKTVLPIGMAVKASVKKNKITGCKREAAYDVYTSYGIDDISSCVDFLTQFGFLDKSGATYDMTDIIGKKGTMAAIISAVEACPQTYHDLRVAVGQAWKTIEDSVAVKRPSRYA